MGKENPSWLTVQISKLAYRLHPAIGNMYKKDTKFWNDGIVGFIIGVPLTYILYEPLSSMVWAWYRPIFYIGCAFISFCIQHALRRVWVFKK